MNINKIKNTTLAKLTAEEIGNLWLCNYGVGLYKGELKSRKQGFTTTRVGCEVRFAAPAWRIVFVKLTSINSDGLQEWAARIYNKNRAEYETYPMGIFGCEFFR